MTDHDIYYLIAFIAYLLHTFGKIEQRHGTVMQWLKDNRKYLFITTLIQAAVLLIGPGDGIDYGSNAARMFAFSGSFAVAEVVRMGFKIPEERKARMAAKEST